MKTLALLAFFFAQTMAQAYPLLCKSNCQHYDDFNNQCFFYSTCTYSNQCMSYNSCEKFDDFNNQCVSVATETKCHTPNPFIGSPSCTENCQYFDNFENKCLYRTRCEYSGTCMTYTRCERWDDFYNRCYTEEKTTQCN